MSSTKAKGGTGRGTGKKGWTRWQVGEKKKLAKKVFGRNKGAKDGTKDGAKDGDKEKVDAKSTSNAKSGNMSRGSTAFKGGIAAKGKK